MKPIFVKNTLIDEKRISFIEKVVTRLARKSQKKTTAIITPYPISACIEGDEVKGDVLKYMFCASGTITKGRVWLGKQLKHGYAIVLTIENELGSNSSSYNVVRQDTVIKPNVSVFSGDRLTISVYPINPEEDKITELWIGFLWIPKIADAQLKHFLLEDLEKLDVPEGE